MKRTGIVLAVLLVLLVLLVVADRAGEAYAERAIADDVQASTVLDSRPDVEVTGVPFLTQALSGRYDRIEVRATDVPADELMLSRLDATLTGVRAPLSHVVSDDLETIPVESVTARALVPYEALTQRYGDSGLIVEPEGDGRLRVTGRLRIFGQTLAAVALSRVEVEDGDIVIVAEEIGLGEEGGGDDVLTQALREQLDLRVPVEDLPYDLTVTGAEVRPDGVALRAEATDVVLRRD